MEAQTDALRGGLSGAERQVAAPADTSRGDRSGVQTRGRDVGVSVETPMGTMAGALEVDGVQESVMTGIQSTRHCPHRAVNRDSHISPSRLNTQPITSWSVCLSSHVLMFRRDPLRLTSP